MGWLSGSAFVLALWEKFSLGWSLLLGFDTLMILLVPFTAGMLYVKPRDPKYDGKEKRKK
jgi:hypothetical protein